MSIHWFVSAVAGCHPVLLSSLPLFHPVPMALLLCEDETLMREYSLLTMDVAGQDALVSGRQTCTAPRMLMWLFHEVGWIRMYLANSILLNAPLTIASEES
jgi:hypothetical protein